MNDNTTGCQIYCMYLGQQVALHQYWSESVISRYDRLLIKKESGCCMACDNHSLMVDNEIICSLSLY